ncbi:MAG: lysophospholipid acyltransferase family protein [Acidimicrobiaceae bacterium]|nr:lysophospholipid acyltransferase family protein [Acidimicrobiaceae bacterium]
MRDYGQLQAAAKILLRPVLFFLWRVTVVGLDNVPADGPAILASNHTSVSDSYFLPAVLPRGITFVGKSEYLDDWKTRRLFPAVGMIPIDREGGDASSRALDAAARVLEGGELFGIYPEGTRSRDGLLHKGHTGAARLALRTRAPIIPVGILGSRAVQPPDAKAPRPFRPVEVRFGKPLHGAPGGAAADQRFRARQLTDELMFEIGSLTGQDYVDEYAAKGPAAPVERA